MKVCKYGYLPAGFYFTQHAAFNSQNANCANSNSGRVGGLLGDAWINSKILMRYDFVVAGCNGGPAGKACFGGPIALDMRSVAVDMMYNNTTFGTSIYVAENNAGYWDRVGISGAQNGNAGGNTIMCHFVGDEGVARESACVGGTFACLNDGRATQLTVAPCIDAGSIGIFGNSGSYFSKGNFFNAGGGAVCDSLGASCAAYCAAGAVCHHENDYFNGGTIGNAGTAFYKRISTNVGGTSNAITNTSGGVMSFQDTTSPATITNNAGGTVIDELGNALSGTFTNNGVYRHRETGTCTFAAATTCTVTFAVTFGTTTPTFLIQPINPGAVTFTVTALSASAATITASGANSLSVGWESVLQ